MDIPPIPPFSPALPVRPVPQPREAAAIEPRDAFSQSPPLPPQGSTGGTEGMLSEPAVAPSGAPISASGGTPPAPPAPRSGDPAAPPVLLEGLPPALEPAPGPDLRRLVPACDPLAGLVPGYAPEVEAMALRGPHTIHDLEGYLADNLGAETLKEIRDGHERFVIYAGEGSEVQQALRDRGWTVLDRATKSQGFHQVLHVATETGERLRVISRVNGSDRVVHLQSMLALAGLPADRVATTGSSRSFTQDYLARFAELGPAPDLVVYGMARTAVGALLSAHPIRNARHLLGLMKQVHSRPSGQGPRPDHDLAGLSMHVMELENGKRVWFFPPLYGDLSKDLLDALLAHGARDITFVGTAGAIRAGFEVGEMVTPREHVRPDGSRASLDWLRPAPGATPCTYMRVPTPNLETQRWADETRARGVDMIEVELGYWLDALEKRPDVGFRVQNVLSDVLEGEGARDMTQWGRLDNLALQSRLRGGLESAWGMDGSDLRVRHYEAVPILPQTQARA